MPEKQLAIALLGYGKMGKAIETEAAARGHKIVCKIDNKSDWLQQADALSRADVAIEFSVPEAALSNMVQCFEHTLPVVVGTTGWYDRIEEVRQLCIQQQTACIWAANFSVGMNAFLKTSAYMAKLMAPFTDYKTTIHEVHHTQKLDAPSGTAIAIANSLAQVNNKLQPWQLIEEGEAMPEAGLPITYARCGQVFGEHYLHFNAPADSLSLKHEAHNRSGFAKGAIIAAEYIHNKQGFYAFADLFEG